MTVSDLKTMIHGWEETYGFTALWGAVGAVLLLVIIADIAATWKLVKRMGYPGLFGLLFYTPASLLAYAGFALWKWPAQKR